MGYHLTSNLCFKNIKQGFEFKNQLCHPRSPATSHLFFNDKKITSPAPKLCFFFISLINVYAFHRYSCYHFYFIHTTAKRGKIRRNITCLFSQYFALLIYLSFYENLFFLGEYGGSGKIVLSIISSTLS